MIRYPIKILAGFLIVFLLILVLSFYFLGTKVSNFTFNLFQSVGLSSFYGLSSLEKIIIDASNFRSLSYKLSQQEEENRKLNSDISKLLFLKKENEILQKTLNISRSFEIKSIPAGVFSFISTPDDSVFLINKGSNDGVEVNDGVLSVEGILAGQVIEVSERHSRVVAVDDLDFKTTILTQEKGISGIARGSLDGNMIMEFVSESEEIVEGEIVVTSGNDFLLGGIVLGRVGLVKTEAGGLFKEVRIDSGIKNIKLSNVIVIKK